MKLSKVSQALAAPTEAHAIPRASLTPVPLPPEGLAKLPAVMNATSVSRSGIYEKIKNGQFPAPVKLGARAVGFRVEEVRAWIAARTATGAK